MTAFLFAGSLLFLPSLSLTPATGMDAVFENQRQAAIRDIRIDIQADLERRGKRFFLPDGGLRRILDSAMIATEGFAAR
ncbi:MAG TPA: hypothetical protein VF267_13075 [Gammaproteobacteria bacterium]